MSRALLPIALVSFLFGASGCEAVTNYPRDRLMDLVDVVGFELYWGQGVLAQGRMTKVAQLGFGAFDGDVMRYSRREIGILEEMRAEAGVPIYYFTAYDRRPLYGNEGFMAANSDIEDPGRGKYNLTDPQDRGFYEVGLAGAFFLGVGADVDILQTLDFVLGWIGLDICRDDVRHRDTKPIRGPRFKGIKDTPVSGAGQAETLPEL